MKYRTLAAISVVLIIVLALSACGKSSDNPGLPTPAPTYSISGSVTQDGQALQGVTVTLALNGTDYSNTITDASGNYTFETLSPGTYTVTPALAGYAYTPSAPSITISSANQTQNFTAASVVASNSISGTISYGGTHTGRIYIGLKNADGSATGHGTSISAPGNFIIHGVPTGTYYKLSAEMDIHNDGTLNQNDPSGEILTITVSGANLTGQNITLTDPSSEVIATPVGLTVSPANGAALIHWYIMTSGYKIIADSYKIYWGTDSAATNQTPITIAADRDMYMQTVANGTYYYKISAVVGSTESAASAVAGPVTIGAATGLNTVSGTVTSSVTPTGPLYVGLDAGYGIYYFTKIQSPSASQAYSFAGVPNGTYRAIAFADQNNTNSLDSGDLVYDNLGSLPIVINNSNPTVDLWLTNYNSRSIVSTEHWTNGSTSSYRLDFAVTGITDLPAKAQVAAGQNIPVPMDLQKANNSIGGFSCMVDLGAVRPDLTDSYNININYYDGVAEEWTEPVTAVLDSFVQNIYGDTTTTPTYNWTAPASPPAFFTYYIEVYDSVTGNLIWYYPSQTPYGMPSTQTSVVYNVDGTASQSALTTGRAYYVFVTVRDANFNSAWYGVSDTPTTASTDVLDTCGEITITPPPVVTATSLREIRDSCGGGVSGTTTLSGTLNVTGSANPSGGSGTSTTTGGGIVGQNTINGSLIISTH
ncbi:MAG TPA: carboxypeptidase-like regulatory domain-containing protein [Smithella sp.]|nr:carboxypeptidase-like regulatory domain-containing protein [Smithella sp.]